MLGLATSALLENMQCLKVKKVQKWMKCCFHYEENEKFINCQMLFLGRWLHNCWFMGILQRNNSSKIQIKLSHCIQCFSYFLLGRYGILHCVFPTSAVLWKTKNASFYLCIWVSSIILMGVFQDIGLKGMDSQ